MSYQVPDYSSSPMGSPATPERRPSNSKNIFSMSNNPSTTPAGPPPSSANSFTPAGQPPSSFLGSSMVGASNPIKPLSFSGQSAFNPQQSFNPGSSRFLDSLRSSGAPKSGLNREYQPSPERGFHAPGESDYEDEDSGDYTQEDDTFDQSRNRRSIADQDEESIADEEPQYEDDDEDMEDNQSDSSASRERSERGSGQSSMGDLLLNTPGAMKRSTEGGMLSLEEPFATGRRSSSFSKIAKDIYTQLPTPEVVESDDLVLNTESIITRLYEQGVEDSSENELQETLADISGDLAVLWSEYYKKTQIRNDDAYAPTIGPGAGATNFSKANFIAGLALQLNHLPPDSTDQRGRVMSFPLVLLNWLEVYHNPFPDQLEEVMLNNPTPGDHRLFWDTIFNSLLRGKVGAVCQLLERSDWRYARAALGDSRDVSRQDNYSPQVVANVEKVIEEAYKVFRQCPCMNRGRPDWNTRNRDWTLFRLKASRALEDLKSFAEGRDKDEVRSEPRGFGKPSANPGSYSTIAEKAGSKIPWNIYQNLITLYNFAIGDAHTVIESASDWCEAAIGLLVWWDEGKEERRVALGHSRFAQQGYEEEDSELYFRKLRKSFVRATADSTDFEVNTLNAPEVALASLFEGDYESVVGFLRGWSGPVSSAVAEVATIGEWLPQAEPQDLIAMGSLDQEDMDLLGVEPTQKVDSVKDQTLITYAKSVSRRKELKSKGNVGQKQASRAGWEIAIAVLGRLDSAARSEEMVGIFLEDFRLDSSSIVDKLWLLLQDVGMGHHAEDTAESYANALAKDTHNYGEALWYYALAHKADKVKDVLDLLISHSLLQSTAFPATVDLDDHLRRVITSPKTTLVELSRMDVEAAELLRNLLSGYATLRKFYNIRDEAIQAAPATKVRREVTRKNEAAAALLTVISSAGDNIAGGLYDPQSGAVVNVDFLLALLGEAMPFVNQPNSLITTCQIGILLKAIEDLQTVGPRVYNACSEFLQTVLASAQGLKGSTPHDMLRKSTSNLSGSFSMVGSSMFASQMKKSISGSGVLVKGNVKRGWDWRKGVTANITADDLLRILRLGLAKDLAGAWLREVDGIQ